MARSHPNPKRPPLIASHVMAPITSSTTLRANNQTPKRRYVQHLLTYLLTHFLIPICQMR